MPINNRHDNDDTSSYRENFTLQSSKDQLTDSFDPFDVSGRRQEVSSDKTKDDDQRSGEDDHDRVEDADSDDEGDGL